MNEEISWKLRVNRSRLLWLSRLIPKEQIWFDLSLQRKRKRKQPHTFLYLYCKRSKANSRASLGKLHGSGLCGGWMAALSCSNTLEVQKRCCSPSSGMSFSINRRCLWTKRGWLWLQLDSISHWHHFNGASETSFADSASGLMCPADKDSLQQDRGSWTSKSKQQEIPLRDKSIQDSASEAINLIQDSV